GRLSIDAFAGKPQHHYLLRLVDPPERALPLPDTEAVIARGPSTQASDLALLSDCRITHIVAKNAGGSGARATLFAARTRCLPVLLIDRPTLPPRRVAAGVDEALAFTVHATVLGV